MGWTEAVTMFDSELFDQPRPPIKGGSGTSGGAGAANGDEVVRESRWTLETFSMWLLKRGRRLRECSQWFRAFDFDRDDMVSISDFLQGLVAVAAPRAVASDSASG